MNLLLRSWKRSHCLCIVSRSQIHFCLQAAQWTLLARGFLQQLISCAYLSCHRISFLFHNSLIVIFILNLLHFPPSSLLGDHVTNGCFGAAQLGSSDPVLNGAFFHYQNHFSFSNFIMTLHYYVTFCSYEMALFMAIIVFSVNPILVFHCLPHR